LGGTDATGNIACPEYPVLGGSGTVSEEAPVEAAGVIAFVVVKAALAGNCGALTTARVYIPVFGSELHAARNNVTSAIAPPKFSRRIRRPASCEFAPDS